ncbi:UNVERIFIED_ORG: FimV-like protein [Burkholderia sp. CF145]|uniref:FimV/HubP family polar landmark protein n=1 Tax=Paraburkholderia hospita TaxID=169430 RepID=UPI000271CF38|nr:FimV/HubP family polar landmark protein [Paraburkholderia hospita]EUC18285.1 Motility protein FimV [Burkholderia sp. BT03]SKC76286.1 FimV C-terminal domain-containing protein [Paraburkholderia hospita]
MTARFPLIPAATRSGSHRIAAAVAIVFAGALSIPGAAYAQTTATAAASAPAGAASGVTQFTVQPGQSLNDAAVAMTQSHDRAVLARAGKAIFDANPNAFMGHDPSRLRLGAVLNLPAVDATGVAIGTASAATAASAASGAAAQAATTNNAAATTSASAPAATAAGASAATTGASSPAEAAATIPTQSASAPATAEATSAPAAGALPTSGAAASSASGASGTRSYTGSIQGSESAATPPSTPATSNAQPASQPRPSSLQQLLALKNRVLMELQKHGIGKQPGTNENAPTAPGATQSSSATPGAGAPAHAAPAATQPANQPMGISQEYLGVAAIVGAGLVALLAGLTMRRRRKAARAQEVANDDVAREAETPVAPTAVEPVAVARSDEPPASLQEPSETGAREAGPAAVVAAAAISPAFDHDAAPKLEPETFDSASAEAALDAAATLGADALPRESLDPAREEARAAEAAERQQAAREQELTTSELAADTPSAELPLDEQPIHEPVEPHFAEPIEAPHDESGAKPKPFALDLGATPGAGQHEPTFEQPTASIAPPIQLSHVEPAGQHEQLIEPLPELNELHPADAEDAAEQRASASLPLGAPPPLEPAVPDAFPRDAMRALDSIDDFALPPRVERSATDAPAVTQPVVAPEITAQQAVPAHAPQAPAVADEIIAGMAGAAAVAGLGAARFGALKLDFDLELPPSPSQVVPAFTPDEVARIARNKLDLAVEYIDLGDVVGARTLINEVIESNDVDTRADARALLSTLAPLS